MLWEYPMGVSENGPYLKKSKAILRGNTKIHWIFRHLLSDKPRKTYTTYGKHSSKHTESTACWCLNHHEYGLRSGWTWAFRYFSWGYVRWIVILSVLTVLALLTRDTADFFLWAETWRILGGGYGFMALRPSQVRRCSLSQCLAKPRLTSQLPGTVTPVEGETGTSGSEARTGPLTQLCTVMLALIVLANHIAFKTAACQMLLGLVLPLLEINGNQWIHDDRQVHD